MAQSERERAIAIKEAHNIAASKTYFKVRTTIVHPQPHRIFDAAFSRGWDAATVPLLAQIAQLEAQLAEARKDAERFQFAADPQSDGFAVCEWIDGDWIPINTEDLDAAIAQEQKL